MISLTRPGIPLHEDEVLAAILGDAVDGLESFQVPTPHPGIEDILQQIKYVRRELIERIPEEIKHGQEVGE